MVIYLNYSGIQAAYWAMLEEGRITQATAIILMQSVDEAMDRVSHEPLCDWKGLKAHVHFPSYYRLLQQSRLPQRVITYFTVQRLETACYICAAFLRAHRTARRKLREFIGMTLARFIATSFHIHLFYLYLYIDGKQIPVKW